MPPRIGAFRPSQYETDEIARLRKTVKEAASILKNHPQPDTFLGRKTQEPFPKETRSSETILRRLLT